MIGGSLFAICFLTVGRIVNVLGEEAKVVAFRYESSAPTSSSYTVTVKLANTTSFDVASKFCRDLDSSQCSSQFILPTRAYPNNNEAQTFMETVTRNDPGLSRACFWTGAQRLDMYSFSSCGDGTPIKSDAMVYCPGANVKTWDTSFLMICGVDPKPDNKRNYCFLPVKDGSPGYLMCKKDK